MDVRQYNRFCDLIRALRRQHRLSQRALAHSLEVSPGYVGQWELRLSQPSREVTLKLCHVFSIDDVEYVQRLAYAGRAPEWLRESIICYQGHEQDADAQTIRPVETRVLDAMRRLSTQQAERLADRVEGWVDALLDEEVGSDEAK